MMLPDTRQTLDTALWLPVLVLLHLLLAGCADQSLEFTEVKRISEKVTEAELNTFLRVVNSLPASSGVHSGLPFFPFRFCGIRRRAAG